MGIFKEMEMAIIKLMQELGIITPEAGNMMQEQAKQGLQGMPPMGGAPGTAGGAGGMPPGANPLDMLQLQQLAQFEQMQKFMQQQPSKKWLASFVHNHKYLSMARSPILSGILFWGSFMFFQGYASRDPRTGGQRYPSYAIFKEKILRDTWRDGWNSARLCTDWGHFTMALKEDIKHAIGWSSDSL